VTSRRERRGLAGVTRGRGILFGGDYNPEQWPRDVWREDVRLMQAAGVNLVTLGVFSWARLEPAPGEYDLDWMREVLDLLHRSGIAVDLATPTASPPPWLGVLYPETLPRTAEGVQLTYGSRNQFAPSSPVYRERAAAVTRAVVRSFVDHPGVVMWHVGNELGQVDFSDQSAAAFRRWLADRYGTIEELNEAWATSVWSQRYRDFGEVLPPRSAPYHRNPSQELDFRRFVSDELLAVYRDQAAVIRELDLERPITTNFMGFFEWADYASWAEELDVISDDAYPDPEDREAPADSALTQHLMRSLADGAPWLLMESAVSAVSWRPHNLTKSPARSRRESLQAVANGADGVCFFQWRAARSGPERFHSAMVPVQGSETAVHAGVVRLGADLARLGSVVGEPVDASVALVWDWPSWWAARGQAMPTDRLDPLATLRGWHRALWHAHVVVDVVRPSSDLSRYAAVFVPSLYLMTPASAGSLGRYVAGGGTLVVGPFSGVADDEAHLHVGRFPVLLRDVLGVSGEEWVPLPAGGVPAHWVTQAGALGGRDGFRVETFAEHTRSEGAEPIVVLAAAPHVEQLEGAVAVARNPYGSGSAWYVGAVLPPDELAALLGHVLQEAGVEPTAHGVPAGVEVVLRGRHLFVLNHRPEPVRVPAETLGEAIGAGPSAPWPVAALRDLITGEEFGRGDAVELAPDGVVVLTAAG
jgi:beta-galactosidase